jgi:hypothetical protein
MNVLVILFLPRAGRQGLVQDLCPRMERDRHLLLSLRTVFPPYACASVFKFPPCFKNTGLITFGPILMTSF